jgi:hypothetical protein
MRTSFQIAILLVVAILVSILLTFVPVSAVPSGTSVDGVTNNQANFSANDGGTGADWFEYGMTPQTLVVWTPNLTASGTYTWTEIGSPLTSGETYYVAGCDTNGCDPNPASFTVLDATPLPSTTLGILFTNATRNKFNTIMFVSNIMAPYMWLFPASATSWALTIVVAVVLFAIFFGLAMRTRYVAVPVVVGLLTAPYLLYQNQGLNLGIPVEFQAIAQGILYACLAGILMLILKKG